MSLHHEEIQHLLRGRLLQSSNDNSDNSEASQRLFMKSLVFFVGLAAIFIVMCFVTKLM